MKEQTCLHRRNLICEGKPSQKKYLLSCTLKDAVLVRYGETEMAVLKEGFVLLTDP